MKRTILLFLLTMVIFFVFDWLLNNSEGLKKLELQRYNRLCLDIVDTTESVRKLVILEIDHKSYESIGELECFRDISLKWPWNRRIYAKILELLRQTKAKTVGFDIFFGSESREDPGQDSCFSEEIRKSGNVILAGYSNVEEEEGKEKVKFVGVPGIFSSAAWAVATVNTLVDREDNIIRRFQPFWIFDDLLVKHFAVSLFEHCTGLKSKLDRESKRINFIDAKGDTVSTVPLNPDGSLYIRYFNFNEYSDKTHLKPFSEKTYLKVLSVYDFIRDFEIHRTRPYFDGAVVLIGPTHYTFHDNHKVPLSDVGRYSKKMPGVEIHANILLNLLDRKHITAYEIPDRWKFLIALVLSALCFMKVRWSVSGLAVLGITMYAASIQLFTDEFLYVPIVHMIAVCICTVISTVIINYIQEIRSKNMLRSVFKQYMNDEVIQELINDPGKMSLGGSKKKIVILFADIRGFTSLSEKLNPEEVVRMLNSFFEAMLVPIEKYSGILDKFMGDCVMVIFGGPIELENAELNAVKCAVEMVQSLNEFRKNPMYAEYNVNIGIGVNSGDVIIGNIGTEAHKDYTVIGDNVNLASRLESSASRGEVVISHSVYSRLDESFTIAEQKSIQVKGKAKALDVYVIRP